MPCSSPLWIRNRRYFDKSRSTNLDPHDDHLSAFALRPWDIARRRILIPCGKCPDCLRRLRNDWFVRIDRELARCRDLKQNAVFLTITISPKYYASALSNPSSFIRMFNERLRHRLGSSIKHIYFQEFGTHPEIGDEPRLHFHGFLFNVTDRYNDIRSAIGDLGFIWIGRATHRRARYVVKYVTKQIDFDPDFVKDKYIKLDGQLIPLSTALCDRRYTRKFVSAHVGDYLGRRCRPTASICSWSYFSFKDNINYSYTIPRYYNKYLSEEDELVRSIRSASAYASLSDDPLVKCVVSQCFSLSPKTATLSLDRPFEWIVRSFRKRFKACSTFSIVGPALIPSSIIEFWQSNFNISLNYG